MRTQHAMPFGAELMPDGGVRFRLWAPGAHQVTLCLEEPSEVRYLPMRRLDGGWYELVTSDAGPGSLYRFCIDGGWQVPDPASRFNPKDVHGPSEVIDPTAYCWQDVGWRGRPWEETVVYELHVGTFTQAGTFRAVIDRLDYLATLGVTAIELMPIADFPGRCDWGYNGVLLFAPDAAYGRPENLKALVDAAHARRLMVFLDVVYNHFGPEGNYLHLYAPQFFSDRHHTLWGAAINFDGEGSCTVRDFFIHNALYWLKEYHIDGLRLDAVHAILDNSPKHILEELAEVVHKELGQDRQVHLILENDANQARFLQRDDGRPRWYSAQWNDDFHHACHVLLTGEADGYYADYLAAPACSLPSPQPRGARDVWHTLRRGVASPRVYALCYLGRCLTTGFAWQGQPSPFRGGKPRGQPSSHLPTTAFVTFLQNHDQVGNRAFGERLRQLTTPEALKAALAITLLAPQVPLLFMGEEFGALTPFLFFCDLGEDLRDAVREGRRREFACFERFKDPAVRQAIPDPCDFVTFASSRLDWACLDQPEHREWLAFYRRLLELRRQVIVPRLAGTVSQGYKVLGERILCAAWRMGDGTILRMIANLSATSSVLPKPLATGQMIWVQPAELELACQSGELLPWSVVWLLA